jgi:signal transduction histidine kinase/CheY-like chemotaxis protein
MKSILRAPLSAFFRRLSQSMARLGIAWLFALALFPGVLAGTLLLYEVYQSEKAQLEQGTMQTARALSLAVDKDLAGIMGKLQILATSPSVQTGDLEAFQHQAQDVLSKGTLAEAIVLIDRNGQQVMNTLRPYGAALPKTGNKAIVEMIFESGLPAVSDLYTGGVPKQSFVALEVPVWWKGKVIYALAMSISAARLNQLLVDQNLPQGWLAALVDSQGIVVARSQNAAYATGKEATPDLIAKIKERNEGTLASETLEGLPSFITFSRSRTSNWTIAIAMTRSVLYSRLYRPIAMASLAIVTFLLGGVFLAFAFSRHVRRALQTLGVATEAAALGDMDAVAPLSGPREIARLAEQFNHMQEMRKSDKEALIATREAAESANRAKSGFLSTMSHEIRTPLNAVVGLTGLLADSPLDRRQRDYVGKLLLSAQALRELVDDILDFSKIEAGALRLEQAPFSLNAILRTTAAVVSVGMRDKPIEALFDVAHDIPDTLIGDAVRLRQILLNLTSNAIKFTEAGEMVVSVRCLARQAGQVTLHFFVRDTGIGIPDDQLEHIFELFAQADTSITRQYGGTGLGLAISARLAKLMGAEISVDSAPGRGSKFGFTVTLALADRVSPPAPAVIPPKLSILIIDDHPLARDILIQTCAGFGWQARACGSGTAGLDELRRSAAEGRDYDLMLLDWRMPGMDGIEMLRLAYDAADIGLPQVILMASLFELEQAAAASDDLYLDGIAAKPMTPASLFDVVTRAHCGDFTGILPPSDKTDRRLAGMHLLVAEDNAINQQVIDQILTRAGAEVVIAGGALAAIAALRLPGARFDAILMDIQMPGMDGHAAARVIREEMGLVDLPIIAVTAHALPEDREKSRRAGMAGHILKPIDIEDLLDILLGGRQVPPGQPAARLGPPRQTTAPAILLAGVDVVAALKAFGGDAKKHVELLRQFVLAHGGDAGEARRLFCCADWEGAARLVHGLRGMASLLQATDVARLTAAIATGLRRGQEKGMLPLFDELQIAIQALGKSIDQFDAIGAGA